MSAVRGGGVCAVCAGLFALRGMTNPARGTRTNKRTVDILADADLLGRIGEHGGMRQEFPEGGDDGVMVRA